MRDCGGDKSDRRNVWSLEVVVVDVVDVPFPGVSVSAAVPLVFFALALALVPLALLLVRFPSGVRPGLSILVAFLLLTERG